LLAGQRVRRPSARQGWVYSEGSRPDTPDESNAIDNAIDCFGGTHFHYVAAIGKLDLIVKDILT
jgi:hypothetical protein